ncbi:hypothetical protein [Anaeroselena agilis]|uniref:DUF1540 domain-containing protein n=1 Tax=Anaeroselena agilis TaxID=3063788 RepID=A0ABU3NWF0_9FIRM|nr:hypothetical protein [Selenomonadales bacterium 4137-cl]
MPTVECKLTDCRRHGREICIAKRISIDGCGLVECYDPVPRSSIVHGPFLNDCRRRHGKWQQNRGNVLK